MSKTAAWDMAAQAGFDQTDRPGGLRMDGEDGGVLYTNPVRDATVPERPQRGADTWVKEGVR